MKQKKKQDRPNQVRIIGGSHRSRLIRFPDQQGLRPTSDRIRETVFNWLQDKVVHSRCLDLFAGSGAFGFEALSRGASLVQFVESDNEAARAITANIEALGMDRGEVSQSRAENWLAHTEGMQAFDVIFLDPPYAEQKLIAICDSLATSQCVKSGTVIYLENDKDIDFRELPANWKKLKQKKAGQVHFYLLEIG